MRIRTMAVALLALPALAFTACGEDEAPASGGGAAAGDDKSRQAELAFAECMREQGVDMPDPEPGSGGRRAFRVGGDSGISPEAFEQAREACGEHLEGVRPEMSEEQQEEFKESALAHARCMREHGIDMPDPTFGEGGRVQQALRGGINPEDPRFQEAQEECSQYQPRMRMERDAQ